MNHLRPLLCFTAALHLNAVADVENDLPLGIEALTGYGTSSVYRGLELADAALDFQLSTEIALDNTYLIGLSGWHVAESSGEFSETSGELSLIHRSASLSLAGGVTVRDFDSAIVDSGAEIFLEADYSHSADLSYTLRFAYDDAVQSALLAGSVNYSRVINESAYWGIKVGAVAADDFYGASGLVNLDARLSLTYLINSQLSITPFLAHSEGFGFESGDDSTTFGGVWLAISF